MAKKKCASCDYFTPFEDESGKGGCTLLSTVDSNEEVDAGAEGEFWCSADWGCASHSANEPTDMGQEPEMAEPAEPGTRRSAADYL